MIEMPPNTWGPREVPWEHLLPDEWALEPLKYHVTINERSLPDSTDPDYEFRYIDIGSVDGRGHVKASEDLRFGAAPSRARRIVRTGDTIVSTVRTYLRAIAHIPAVEGNVICSTGFAVITPSPTLEPRFLTYWLRANQMVDEIMARSTGVSYPAIAPTELGSLPVPVIPLQRQAAIADFLDEKTAWIDRLIVEKLRTRSLLRRRLQAAIDRETMGTGSAGTPSGGGWPPPVPAGWQAIKLKYLAQAGRRSFTDGDWVESPYITDQGVRLIQTGNIGRGRYKEQGFRYISEESFRELGCTEVQPGDVLICRLAHPVGRACVAPDLGCRMITAVDVAILKPADQYNARFLVYSLSSSKYLAYVDAICRGGTRDRISRSMLGEIKLLMPPRSEQDAIVTRLDAAREATWSAVESIEAQVAALREYRRSLISSAVTRGLAAVNGAEEPL